MTTHLRTVMAGVLLATGALAATVAVTRHDGGDHASAPVAAVPTTGPYVALGDSYTSGPKIPGRTGTPAGCARSDHNYPALVAAHLGVKAADFRDMSCSGATITDFTAAQSTKNGTNPAQLSALSSKTRLVTLGIGGNDIDFGDMITRCVASGAAYGIIDRIKDISEGSPCESHYVDGGTDQVSQKIKAAGARLSDALDEIRQRAPHARVYVVGYPSILPYKGSECGRELPITPGDINYLRDKERQLNSMLSTRARAVGAVYVDTYTPSQGRDACSAEDTRWIEPLVPTSPAASVHPNARGEHGMADAVLRALDVSR